jgi:hypothetical protein
MAVVLEIIDLLVCRKIHGCGCFADDPAPRESKFPEITVGESDRLNSV